MSANPIPHRAKARNGNRRKWADKRHLRGAHFSFLHLPRRNEIRNPKSEGNPKLEIRNGLCSLRLPPGGVRQGESECGRPAPGGKRREERPLVEEVLHRRVCGDPESVFAAVAARRAPSLASVSAPAVLPMNLTGSWAELPQQRTLRLPNPIWNSNRMTRCPIQMPRRDG
jgi:hypothetical protein